MKTRAEIYSKEAADILRNITTYHYMRHDQLLRLYPGKEEKIDNLISYGELYKVIYVETGGEALIEHAVAKQPDDAEKRVVIVESAEQIGKLNIPDVTAYCTVDMNTGAVQYYKQE